MRSTPNDGGTYPPSFQRLSLSSRAFVSLYFLFNLPAPYSHVTMDLFAQDSVSNSHVPA